MFLRRALTTGDEKCWNGKIAELERLQDFDIGRK